MFEEEARSPVIVNATIALVVTITLFVLMRMYVRLWILKKAGWEEALTVISWGFAIIFAGSVLWNAQIALGRHLQDVSKEQFTGFLKLNIVASITYIWAFVTIKMSFAVLYLRFLADPMYRIINISMIVILTAQGIEQTAVVIFQCSPIDKAWTPTKTGSCIELLGFYYASFAIKFITDLVLFIEPIPSVWKLQLPKAKKIGVIFMLSIGLFVCIISIVRVVCIGHLDADITNSMVDPMLWSEIEVCALIVCSCVPSIRPLIRKFPSLNHALGLSSFGMARSGGSDSGKHATGRSTEPKRTISYRFRPKAWTFGSLNSTVTVSEDRESQKLEKEGVIMVTKRFELGVERPKTDDSPKLTDSEDITEGRNSPERRVNRETPLYPGRLAGV